MTLFRFFPDFLVRVVLSDSLTHRSNIINKLIEDDLGFAIASVQIVQGRVAFMAETRLRVLHLYRSLLKVGRRMPTKNRQQFIYERTRQGFRDHIREHDPKRIDFLLRLGETQLETAEHQAGHLARL